MCQLKPFKSVKQCCQRKASPTWKWSCTHLMSVPFLIWTTHWKLYVQFMHGYIKWYLWAFYFLLQSKSYHTDTVLMVVMPSGYDKKSLLWCVMKGKTESTSPRSTAGDRLFHFNDFSNFKLTLRRLCSDKRLCSNVASVLLRDRHYMCLCKMPRQHITVILSHKLSTVTHTSISREPPASPSPALNRALFL